MEKFCGRCGSRLDEATGLCPNCDAKDSTHKDGRLSGILKEVRKESKTGPWQDAPRSKEEARAKRKADKKATKKERKAQKKAAKKAMKREKWAAKTFGQKTVSVVATLLLWFVIFIAFIGGIVGILLHFGALDVPANISTLWPYSLLDNSAAGGYNPQVILTDLKGNYYEIHLGDKKDVLFTVSVNEKVSDNIIVLETVDGSFLGYMNDNGQDGDLQPGDGIYSGIAKVTNDKIGNVSYRAAYYKTVSNEFDIVFYTEITDEQYLQFDDLYSRVSRCTSETEIEHILKNDGVIDEYVILDDCVVFRTNFGMTGIYEWNCSSNLKGTGRYALADTVGLDYVQAEKSSETVPFAPVSSLENGNVAVLRPFRTSQFKYDDFLYAGQILRKITKGRMDCIDDENVTVETMKSLDNYKITLIDSHGTLSNLTNSAWDILDTDPYMLTGEKYSAFGMWTSADWQSGRIVVCGTNIFYGEGYVAVGSKFFDRYYDKGDLEGALFFLGTCYSMKNNTIAEVLVRKGARVIFGYSDTVYTSYCNATLFETVINSMLLSASPSVEAYGEATRIYGNTDPNNSKCEYRMYGDSDYVIVTENSRTTSDERDIVLVLDTSGSMSGTPMAETKKASVNFIDTILDEDASIGIVTYDNSASMLSDFSVNKAALTTTVSGIYDGGMTNMDAGLSTARSMLQSSNAKKKIIVLMSDGLPNEGRVDDALIAFADEIKNDGILIYTLGFFEALGSDKWAAQQLMEQLASEGCHYEVASADDLVFFFGDIADQINGTRYIYVRIACPVDVSVSYNGETLNSAKSDLSQRTEFGTLTYEKNENAAANTDDRIKILRLKEGVDYDIQIVGTGRGIMDYTIGFVDEEGEYSDLREFEDIKITKSTVIDTVAEVSDETVLRIDEDGDGRYDISYRAEKNGYGEEIRASWLKFAVMGVFFAAILALELAVFSRKRRKRK